MGNKNKIQKVSKNSQKHIFSNFYFDIRNLGQKFGKPKISKKLDAPKILSKFPKNV